MPRSSKSQQQKPLPRRLLVKLKRCAAVNDLVTDRHAQLQCDAWIAKIGAEARNSTHSSTADLPEMYAELLLQQLEDGSLDFPFNFRQHPPAQLSRLPADLAVPVTNRLSSPQRSNHRASLGSPQRGSRGAGLGSPLRGNRVRLGSPSRLGSPGGRARRDLGSPPRGSGMKRNGAMPAPRSGSGQQKSNHGAAVPAGGSLNDHGVAGAIISDGELQRIRHTARWVAKHGDELENVVRVRNANMTAYQFLLAPNSLAGEVYRQMLAAERAQIRARGVSRAANGDPGVTPARDQAATGDTDGGGSGHSAPTLPTEWHSPEPIEKVAPISPSNLAVVTVGADAETAVTAFLTATSDLQRRANKFPGPVPDSSPTGSSISGAGSKRSPMTQIGVSSPGGGFDKKTREGSRKRRAVDRRRAADKARLEAWHAQKRTMALSEEQAYAQEQQRQRQERGKQRKQIAKAAAKARAQAKAVRALQEGSDGNERSYNREPLALAALEAPKSREGAGGLWTDPSPMTRSASTAIRSGTGSGTKKKGGSRKSSGSSKRGSPPVASTKREQRRQRQLEAEIALAVGKTPNSLPASPEPEAEGTAAGTSASDFVHNHDFANGITAAEATPGRRSPVTVDEVLHAVSEQVSLSDAASPSGVGPTVKLTEFAQLADEFDTTAATAEAALQEVSTGSGDGSVEVDGHVYANGDASGQEGEDPQEREVSTDGPATSAPKLAMPASTVPEEAVSPVAADDDTAATASAVVTVPSEGLTSEPVYPSPSPVPSSTISAAPAPPPEPAIEEEDSDDELFSILSLPPPSLNLKSSGGGSISGTKSPAIIPTAVPVAATPLDFDSVAGMLDDLSSASEDEGDGGAGDPSTWA